MPEVISAWITFEDVEWAGKTNVWDVVTKRGGIKIGRIKWYPYWRTYCFFPSPDCVFSSGCMTDIISWIDQAMKERRRDG